MMHGFDSRREHQVEGGKEEKQTYSSPASLIIGTPTGADGGGGDTTYAGPAGGGGPLLAPPPILRSIDGKLDDQFTVSQ